MAILFPVRDFSFYLNVLTFWKGFLALFVNYNENSLKALISAVLIEKFD